MTYYSDCTAPSGILEQVAEQGFDFLPEVIRILIDAAIQGER
jgi:hypothetical protein